MFGQRYRSAFTLIELLIVLAVIGVLIAMLLPALNGVIAASNRLRCSNNLRHIGLAMLSYVQTWDTYPPGGVEWRPPTNPGKRQLAWSAFILPYLEQQPLFDSMNLDQGFDSDANSTAAGHVLSVYICPAVPVPSYTVDGRGICHYGGMYGERITSPNNPPKGAMLYDRVFRPVDIKDGLNVTILVAEDSQFTDGQWINGRNLFDQAFGINAAPSFENDIRSDHPGGAHAVFADGTVRFLDETLDLNVLASICTREGGERTDVSSLE